MRTGWHRLLGWLRREPGQHVAMLAVAATASAAVAMLVAKAACVLAVAETPTGAEQLASEVSLAAAPPWFAYDIMAAALWGLVLGLAFGFARRRWSRRLATAAIALAGAGLGLALFVSVYVYAFWGTPPTWQLLQSLSDPGNANDSVADMMTITRVLFLLTLILIASGGTLFLRWILRHRPRGTRNLAIVLAVCMAGSLAISLSSQPSRFELDRNPVLAFAGSALFGQEYEDAIEPAEGQHNDLFASVTGVGRLEPSPGYRRLARWAKRKPNVVFVILETMAVNHLQLTGAKVRNTPTLSRLAEAGIFWGQHYAHTPSSMFAIYQLLCSNHGKPQGAQISKLRPRIDCGSLSEILVENGYRAGLFHSGRHSYSRKDKFLSGRGYEVLFDTQSMPNRERYRETSWGIEEQASIDALVDWVAEDRSKPFLATYIPVYPHHPYPVPDPKYKIIKGGGGITSYRNSVYYIDQMIAQLLTKLKSIGAHDDTLFVFVGDHGEGFGEHPGSKMHGSKIYDEAVRTFALWYAPGALVRGTRESRVFGHVDVVPTLLDLLGIPGRESHVGTSALSSAPRPMVPLYTGYGNPLVGFVDGRFKFIHNRRTRRSELYDLSKDPRERRSVHSQQEALTAAYRERASAFVGFQASWEAGLPDLTEEELSFEGDDHVWKVNPASCTYSPDHFVVEGPNLRVSVGAEKTVVCETEMPAESGVVTGMTVFGHEAINGNFITAMAVWIAPNGRRRQVAYCSLNGNDRKPARTCEADLVRAAAVLGGGGTITLEIRYVTSFRDLAFDKFGVRDVELRYKTRRE